MISLILSVALAAQSPATPEQLDQACADIGALAQVIMEKRQSGVPLDVALRLVTQHGGDHQRQFKQIVLEAYRFPLMPTDDLKVEAANEFAARWTLWCYDNA